MTRILVAEDDPDIRELIAFTLRFGGFEVITTRDGAEAVEVAPDETPDMILLDVRMPHMTGFEACRALKKNPSTASIPVVFLSAKAQDEEVEAGIESGAVAYILKPFAPDSFLRSINSILMAHPARSSAAG